MMDSRRDLNKRHPARWGAVGPSDDTTTPIEQFHEQGFVIASRVLSDRRMATVEAALSALAMRKAGTRNLLNHGWCRRLTGVLKRHPVIGALLPPSPVAVQCTLFEKSSQRNWLVPMHQDLSIPVRELVEHPHLQGWSSKEGVLYVQAPAAVLETLVAVRVHLDDAHAANGLLRVVPGSHVWGRLDGNAIQSLREQGGEVVCPVNRGCALIMRPLLLHASSKATTPGLRRVLHVLFGPATLPMGLSWHEAV